MGEDFGVSERTGTERLELQSELPTHLAATSDRKVGRSFKKEIRPSTDDGADDAGSSGAEGLETIVDEIADALECELSDPEGQLSDLFDQPRDRIEGRVTPFERLREELRRLLRLKAVVVRQGETVTLDLDQGLQARVTLPLTRLTMIVEVRTLQYVLMISDRLTPAELIEHAANELAHEMEAIAIGKGIEVSYVEVRKIVLLIACETIVVARSRVGPTARIS
jgi:hypothetical protein